MENKNIITRQGLAELKKEMKNLIEVERPKVIEEIKEARALGDLSENSEFDSARERQGQIEDRIQEIENILENSTIVSSNSTSAKITIGSTIEYQDMKSKSKHTVTIVGSLEADPFESKISNNSPLGAALLNAVEGDVVTVQVDKKYNVKVLNVSK